MTIVACLSGAVLMAYPLYLIYQMTVPVEQFRTGAVADFHAFLYAVLLVYGGVMLGIVIRRVVTRTTLRSWKRSELFRSGTWGAAGVALAFVFGAGVRGLAVDGSFARGVGNLWGLVVIFAVVFGAMVAGGLALVAGALESRRTA